MLIPPPIKLGEMKGSIEPRKPGNFMGGVREYLKNKEFYILGAYSYHDSSNNRYVCMYCINYDPWTDTQRPYSKYNYNLPVNW
jgi:hypothetical protein